MLARSQVTVAILLLAVATMTGRQTFADDSTASDLPQYRLKVGQELVYRGSSQFRYKDGAFATRETWNVWVAGQNADLSWRLILSHSSRFQQVSRLEDLKKVDDEKSEASAEKSLGWCDLFPDGRIADKSELGVRLQPRAVFPRLPATTAELSDGWQVETPGSDETQKYRIVAEAPADVRRIAVTSESLMNQVYGIETSSIATVEQRRGLMTKSESSNRQTYGFEGEGTGTLELVEVIEHPAEWSEQFLKESEVTFALLDAYREAKAVPDLTPDEFEAALVEVDKKLEELIERLQTPELSSQVQAQMDRQKSERPYILESAKERAEQIGTPSPAWSTTDMDGHPRTLQDFRGRVVVLDFWYRGCGWCIRAMPQVKSLAEQFRDQPVAVLGMNTDQKEEDARFVIDKLSLNYPTLKATGLPEKYKVSGFPTLVILDQKGIVRDVHVGCSPTLQAEVARTIERLLNEP